MPIKLPDTRLTIRLTPEERALLAAKAGQTPLSSFVRALALEKAEGRRALPKKAPVKDHVALAQILAMLGRADIFAGLNGLAEAVERGYVDLDEDDQAAVKRAFRDIAKVKSLLMAALGISER